MASDAKLAGNQPEIDFDVLRTFVDVVYGAILGYMLLNVAEDIQPYFQDFQSHAVNWRKIWLETFVLNYMIGDFVESRLMTGCFPYRGHARFLIDMAIGFCFLLSFLGAMA